MSERLSLTRLEHFDRVADLYSRRYVADLYDDGFCVALPENDTEDLYEAIVFKNEDENILICDFLVHGYDVYFQIYDEFHDLDNANTQEAIWYTLLYRASAYAGNRGMISFSPDCTPEAMEKICDDLDAFQIYNQHDLIDFIEYQYKWR